ncbi:MULTISPECIES: acyl-CoA dehydrogenase family protein [Streptomyces]|uniref:acyl-CoA dehydrogenase family protein n=1 Tax=Streptomyces TaxID=1883 RepID=UPI0013191369|nr:MULTISPECIES: hydrolase [Streptomyces]QGZ49872.1 hydrolase [Streptomyces sp. QHH-9511]QJD07461.1 hydroxylase [Streptomyces sp.]GGT68351.1 hydrolase [Streptomyces lateritius]
MPTQQTSRQISDPQISAPQISAPPAAVDPASGIDSAAVVVAAADVAKIAAEHARAAERDRRLSPEVVRSMLDAGFARHFVPRRHGGDAGTFEEIVRAVAVVGEGCTSAAWAASLTASLGRMAAYLPEAGRRRIWAGGPDTLIVGALMPFGRARREEGGWRIGGTWPYVSVVDHADWALVCAMTTEERPVARFFAVPRGSWRSEDTWSSVGMRGTGSNTLHVEDVFVSDELTFTRDAVATGVAEDAEAPCHRVPLKAVNGLCFAAPVLGAARAALTAWREGTAPRHTSASGGLESAAAVVLGRAAGEADTAALLLESAARRADSGRVTDLEVARNSRDCALAAELATAAVDRLFTSAGTRAHQESAPLQRHWRDAHSAAGHVVLGFPAAAETYARELQREK